MRVIGAGFGRTGTRSLKEALETLGLDPCYHMVEVFEHPSHIALWEAAAEGTPVDWNELFAGYQAAVDWPTSAFYEPLMEAFPESQVILTVRDPERWYQSVGNTIYQVGRRNGAEPPPPELIRHREMTDAVIWDGIFGGEWEDRSQALDIFERHIAQVKERVPAERLLVYDVRDGWEPLCDFLGVEAPDAPFPHLNDSASWLEHRNSS